MEGNLKVLDCLVRKLFGISAVGILKPTFHQEKGMTEPQLILELDKGLGEIQKINIAQHDLLMRSIGSILFSD